MSEQQILWQFNKDSSHLENWLNYLSPASLRKALEEKGEALTSDHGELSPSRIFGVIGQFTQKNNFLFFPIKPEAYKEILEIHENIASLSPVYEKVKGLIRETDNDNLKILFGNLETVDTKGVVKEWWNKHIADIDDWLFSRDEKTGKLLIELMLDRFFPKRAGEVEMYKEYYLEFRNACLSTLMQVILEEKILKVKSEKKDNNVYFADQNLDDIYLLKILQKLIRFSEPEYRPATKDLNNSVLSALIKSFAATYNISELNLVLNKNVEKPLEYAKKIVERFVDYLYAENQQGEFNLHAAYGKLKPIPEGWHNFEYYTDARLKQFEKQAVHFLLEEIMGQHDYRVLNNQQTIFKRIFFNSAMVKTLQEHATQYKTEKFAAHQKEKHLEKRAFQKSLLKLYREAKENKDIQAVNKRFYVLEQASARSTAYLSAFYAEPVPSSRALRNGLYKAIEATIKIEAKEVAGVLKNEPQTASSFIKAYKRLKEKLMHLLDKFLRIMKSNKETSFMQPAENTGSLGEHHTISGSGVADCTPHLNPQLKI